jgi:hypothetical protein
MEAPPTQRGDRLRGRLEKAKAPERVILAKVEGWSEGMNVRDPWMVTLHKRGQSPRADLPITEFAERGIRVWPCGWCLITDQFRTAACCLRAAFQDELRFERGRYPLYRYRSSQHRGYAAIYCRTG